MPHLDFWYEFASTYSYPAAMRIEAAAKKAGVAVAWRPFLLGPILKAQGLDSSPFESFPGERRLYVARRRAHLRRPGPGLPAARSVPAIGIAGGAGGVDRRGGAGEGRLQPQGLPGRNSRKAGRLRKKRRSLPSSPPSSLTHAAVLHDARSHMVKERFRAETAEAMRLHLFGAPSFVTGRGELFWGNDRLDAALAWAVQETQP